MLKPIRLAPPVELAAAADPEAEVAEADEAAVPEPVAVLEAVPDLVEEDPDAVEEVPDAELEALSAATPVPLLA
jgi:hypothetical protein